MDGDKAQRMARTLRVCRFVLMSVQLGAVLEGSMAPVWLSDPETPLQGRVGHSKEQHDATSIHVVVCGNTTISSRWEAGCRQHRGA